MVKKITSFIIVALLCLSFATTVSAQNDDYNFLEDYEIYTDIPSGRLKPRFNDEADLLSDDEETVLNTKLDSMSEAIEFDIAIVTVNSLQGKTPADFADDYFDYNGFGYGANADGALLLLNMGERDWFISTSGYGIEAIGDDWQYIGNEILPYLSNADYMQAFTQFAYLCEDFVVNGKPVESFSYNDYVDNYSSISISPEKLPIVLIPVSLIIGMIISLIIMFIFRSQLKSVRKKPAARDYQIPGSMAVTMQNDMYLYSRVNRVPKQTQSSSGSRGGGTRVSSSGRSHGGGGGKF